MLHAGHPLASRKQLTCAELMRQPLIFRARGSSTQRVVDRAFAQAGLTPKPLLVLDARDAAYEAVANNIGIGFIWRHGTGRHDAVKRVPVAGMNTRYNEVAFALAGETSVVTDAFLAVGVDYGRMQEGMA